MTQPEASQASLGRKANRGLRWSVIGTFVTKAGNFALGIALARLLAPEDFGVYAVALSAMYLLMQVNDVGLIAATVQWRGRVAEMAATATTIALLFSVLLYVAFWFAAPVIASFANVEEATPILRLLTVVILVDGLTAVRSGSLMRNFQQDRLMVANMSGLAANFAIAIGIAVAGGGAWSFAGGQVGGAVVIGVMVLAAARLPLHFGWDRAVARRLLAYGIPLAASLGVEALLLNVDYVIIGRFTDATQLGFYLLAFNISTWAVSVISAAIRYVSIAGFARLSERDPESLTAGVQRTMPLLITIAVPIAVLTAVLAEPLVTVLYGGRWAPAAPVLSFLAVLTVVRMVTSFAMDILMGAGATRSTLWVNFGWALALVPAMIAGAASGGIQGGAVAHAVVGVVVALPLVLLALRRAGVRLAPIAPTLVRPALGGVAAAAVALLLAQVTAASAIAQVAVAGIAGMAVYLVVAVPREQLRRVTNLLGEGRADVKQ